MIFTFYFYKVRDTPNVSTESGMVSSYVFKVVANCNAILFRHSVC